MRHLGRSLATLLLAAMGLLAPASARAYLDGRTFTDPAVTGGGGGRLFTGAPGDGYDCAVCHRGGAPLALVVEGLPEGGWQPGQRYDLSIAFPEGPRNVGAAIEIADEQGRPVGSLATLPEDDLTDLDRCRTGTAAVAPMDVEDRTVARSEPCGARRARVRWTAPSAPVPSVRMFASVVAADDSGDPSGDSTGRVVQPLRALGEPPFEGGTLSARCSVSAGSRPPRLTLGTLPLHTVLGLVVLGLWGRARRTRARRRGAHRG